MARYTVNVPEYAVASGLRKLTANQWLAEFAEVSGRSKVQQFAHPVTVRYVGHDEIPHTVVMRRSGALFRLFDDLHATKGVIFGLSWKGCSVGQAGLYELNRAIRECAIRKGGMNIVRWWLETRRGYRIPLRGDLAALLEYLEIRPLFRSAKKAAAVAAAASALLFPAPEVPTGKHYVYNRIRHKAKDLRGGKRRHASKNK